MFETTVRDGVLRLRRPGTRWLSTGLDGGVKRAAAAYNVRVPEGWACEDPTGYVAERRERAGFDAPGPTLLTGVELQHARGARLDPVVAYATVGLSNPATLPMDAAPPADSSPPASGDRADTGGSEQGGGPGAGTVNLIVGTKRALDDAALANLVAVVAEAKAATLLALSGFPGTTTDAVVVATDGEGDPERFSGSATPVGAAARACVRDAVRASFRSRYVDHREDEAPPNSRARDVRGASVPDSVAEAAHGVVTDERAEVFEV